MFEATVSIGGTQTRRLLETLTRRAIAQRLTAAGNASAAAIDRNLAARITPRSGDRRRYPGSPHLHGSVSLTFTNLEAFSQGIMEFTVSSASPIAHFIEYGTSPHIIRAVRGKVLRWPGQPGVPIVHHPGSHKFDGFFQNIIASNLRDRFPGINPRFTR